MADDIRAVRPAINDLDVLVVGGSGGLGAAVALAAAKAGARLRLHGRSAERLALVAERCRAASPSHKLPHTVIRDLSGGLPGDELAAAAASCSALVLSYGPFVMKPLSETTPEDWTAMAIANLALPGMLSGIAARAMARRGFGRILFFGGTRTEAVRGFRNNAAYAAAKTGLGVVAKSLAAEFSSQGLSCAVLCPGFIDTEYQDDALKERLAERSPRNRLIGAEEIADVAVWLLSGGMDLCNGAIINADEGLYAM